MSDHGLHPCGEFIPQAYRPEKCSICFFPEKDHKSTRIPTPREREEEQRIKRNKDLTIKTEESKNQDEREKEQLREKRKMEEKHKVNRLGVDHLDHKSVRVQSSPVAIQSKELQGSDIISSSPPETKRISKLRDQQTGHKRVSNNYSNADKKITHSTEKEVRIQNKVAEWLGEPENNNAATTTSNPVTVSKKKFKLKRLLQRDKETPTVEEEENVTARNQKHNYNFDLYPMLGMLRVSIFRSNISINEQNTSTLTAPVPSSPLASSLPPLNPYFEELMKDGIGVILDCGIGLMTPDNVCIRSPYLPGAYPAQWTFPMNSQLLNSGELLILIVNYVTKHPIGYVSLPLSSLTFVHPSVTFGKIRYFHWTPMIPKIEGDIRIGVKLTHVRVGHQVQGEWKGRSAGGSIDSGPTWIFSPQYYFHLKSGLIVSFILQSQVGVDKPIGFYILKKKELKNANNNNRILEEDLKISVESYQYVMKRTPIVDTEISLAAGDYVIIICSKNAGIEGEFVFSVAAEGTPKGSMFLRSLNTPFDEQIAKKDSSNSQNNNADDFDDCFGSSVPSHLTLKVATNEGDNEFSDPFGDDDDDDFMQSKGSVGSAKFNSPSNPFSVKKNETATEEEDDPFGDDFDDFDDPPKKPATNNDSKSKKDDDKKKSKNKDDDGFGDDFGSKLKKSTGIEGKNDNIRKDEAKKDDFGDDFDDFDVDFAKPKGGAPLALNKIVQGKKNSKDDEEDVFDFDDEEDFSVSTDKDRKKSDDIFTKLKGSGQSSNSNPSLSNKQTNDEVDDWSDFDDNEDNGKKKSSEELKEAIDKNQIAKVENILKELGIFLSKEIHNLLFAVELGRFEIVKLLLDYGMDYTHTHAATRKNSLHICAEKGYEEIGKLFLQKGINCKEVDSREETPLFKVVTLGNISFARMMCNHSDAQSSFDIPPIMNNNSNNMEICSFYLNEQPTSRRQLKASHTDQSDSDNGAAKRKRKSKRKNSFQTFIKPKEVLNIIEIIISDEYKNPCLLQIAVNVDIIYNANLILIHENSTKLPNDHLTVLLTGYSEVISILIAKKLISSNFFLSSAPEVNVYYVTRDQFDAKFQKPFFRSASNLGKSDSTDSDDKHADDNHCAPKLNLVEHSSVSHSMRLLFDYITSVNIARVNYFNFDRVKRNSKSLPVNSLTSRSYDVVGYVPREIESEALLTSHSKHYHLFICLKEIRNIAKDITKNDIQILFDADNSQKNKSSYHKCRDAKWDEIFSFMWDHHKNFIAIIFQARDTRTSHKVLGQNQLEIEDFGSSSKVVKLFGANGIVAAEIVLELYFSHP